METQDYTRLLTDAKSYLNTRYELLKLELLDKLSQIVGMIVMVLVVALLLLAGLAFFSVALITLLSNWMPVSLACCLLGLLYVLLIILCLTNKNRWFVAPMISTMGKILFDEAEANQSTMSNQTKEDVDYE